MCNRYIPTLENVLFESERKNTDLYKKRIVVVELLVSIQPLIFFQHESEHVLSIQNILNYYALSGSVIWQRIAVSIEYYVILIYFIFPPVFIFHVKLLQLTVCAILRSHAHSLDLTPLIEHYGDSLLPYLPVDYESSTRKRKDKKIGTLPIIIKGKMKYVKVRPLLNKTLWDRQTAFPDSTLRGPRREIRYVL